MTNEPNRQNPALVGRIPANPHYCPKSSKMLKAPDMLRSIQKAPFAASHPIDEFGHPRPTA